MFQCTYIIFRESFLICAKFTKSIKLLKQNVYMGDSYSLSIDYTRQKRCKMYQGVTNVVNRLFFKFIGSCIILIVE
jgi:hypothetical protein